MQVQSTTAKSPYFFIDAVWVDPASDRISHLHGQFMEAWNDGNYKPHVFDADVALEVFGQRDNFVLLEEVAPGKLQPGPAFRFRPDAEGRDTLYLPDRPLDTLPLF